MENVAAKYNAKNRQIIIEETGEVITIDQTAPREPVPKLAGKMAKVMLAIEGIKKTGFNKENRYDYKEFDFLAGKVRPLLGQHGIAVFADEVSFEEEQIRAKSGASGTRVLKKMQFTFVDSETGQERSVNITGEGVDWGDKAHNKSITSATKYMLIANFLLGGTDSEEESPEFKRGQQRKQTPQQQREQAPQSNAKPFNVENAKKQYAELIKQAEKLGIDFVKMPESPAEGWFKQFGTELRRKVNAANNSSEKPEQPAPESQQDAIIDHDEFIENWKDQPEQVIASFYHDMKDVYPHLVLRTYWQKMGFTSKVPGSFLEYRKSNKQLALEFLYWAACEAKKSESEKNAE